jgi:hypothetical protein
MFYHFLFKHCIIYVLCLSQMVFMLSPAWFRQIEVVDSCFPFLSAAQAAANYFPSHFHFRFAPYPQLYHRLFQSRLSQPPCVLALSQLRQFNSLDF